MTSYNQPPRWADPSTQQHASFGPTWSPSPYSNPNLIPQNGPSNNDERLFATLAHLSAAIAWIVSAGWLNFVGPLVVWLLYRDRSAFVRQAAAGSFNFTVSMTILNIVGWLLVFTIIGAPLGVLMIVASGILVLLLGVLGALKTWRGVPYTYPWQFRVLS